MTLRALIFTVLNVNFQSKDPPDLQRWVLSLVMALAILALLHVVTPDKALNTAIGFAWSICLYALRPAVFHDAVPDDSRADPLLSETKQSQSSRKSWKKKRRSSTSSRKSKFKNSMSDLNEGPPPISNLAKKTHIYTPLPDFIELAMESHELHAALLPHILQPNQLRQNCFPGSGCPPEPPQDNPDERCCCRCGEKFFVTASGNYEADSNCRYHSGKMTTFNGIPGAGPYACCNGNYLSEGCMTHFYHVSAQTFIEDVDLVQTRDKRYSDARQGRNVYALDCEMCYTTQGIEVVKVGLVSADGLTVFDSFVLPKNRVLDYNTAYSGVTASSLRNVSTTLLDVQTFLLKLINKHTILVGHGLENDLRALRIIHKNIVDTSVLYPHNYGHRYKRSLKSLASDFLHKSIQEGENGHNCIEDARTCMELVLQRVQKDKKAKLQRFRDFTLNPIVEFFPRDYIVNGGPTRCSTVAHSHKMLSPATGGNLYVGYLVSQQNIYCCRE